MRIHLLLAGLAASINCAVQAQNVAGPNAKGLAGFVFPGPRGPSKAMGMDAYCRAMANKDCGSSLISDGVPELARPACERDAYKSCATDWSKPSKGPNDLVPHRGYGLPVRQKNERIRTRDTVLFDHDSIYFSGGVPLKVAKRDRLSTRAALPFLDNMGMSNEISASCSAKVSWECSGKGRGNGPQGRWLTICRDNAFKACAENLRRTRTKSDDGGRRPGLFRGGPNLLVPAPA